MEFALAIIFAYLAWLIGRRQGIELGAQAAFEVEGGLNTGFLTCDRNLLVSIFSEVEWDDPESISKVAQLFGEAYYLIIRRDAFCDVQLNSFTDADRAEWERAFSEDMPSIYHAGRD